ncbi:D-inositol-3-phosphate glycosyltransferase [Arthrobacter pityocampae]|uniref:D-inositol-3-phosphate glycosyltransferase n=1 Tax=Arthrobacter pityocampae TaxID=547334 RepID=A0A2S5IVK9_9MICC|nr:D-inositol-3-phosphate glycosyltransferase [Arthrobacter pityocampae]PPB48580.1 D-inositol-3-phosphate glycosyltransferase [Arthrobacter pityocampae]
MSGVRRVAMLSLHTSPLEQPGTGDAGGMNVYVRSTALELAGVGVDVEIFTREAGEGRPRREVLAEGVVVHHLHAGPRRRIPKEALPGLADTFADAITEVADLLADGHFDVLHSHYWVSGMVGLTLSREMNLPLVHSMHTMAKVKNLRMRTLSAPEPAERIAGEEEIVAGAARLIANTSTEANELISLYGAHPKRVDVVAPGVDLSTFHPGDRAAARAALAFPPEQFHVVFAGRIQKLKGPQVLVAAAAELRRRRPDIPLAVSIIGAGSGSEALALQPLIDAAGLTRDVCLYPPVTAPRLAQWFRSANVVAMPSFSESFGLVALEAQACGTPVVAADVGGLPQAVSDGRSGLLVDSHSATDWADALERLHDDTRLRETLGRGAATHALAFGWQRTALLTAQSYRTAVEHFPAATTR